MVTQEMITQRIAADEALVAEMGVPREAVSATGMGVPGEVASTAGTGMPGETASAAATPRTGNNRITRPEMTSFLEEVQMIQSIVDESNEDIPITEIQNLASDQNIGNVASALGTPRILPTSSQFAVPNNPLLPPEYSEILDYNSIQYMNGIFRTQIGRYVKVNQLVGSNNIQEHDGFLIGVGINYVVLQEYDSDNITFIDFYGIKNMYVYFEEIENPYTLE